MNPKKSPKRESSSPDPPATVVLGGQTIILQELNASEGIELCLLVGPYLPRIFKALQEFSIKTPVEVKTRVLRALVESAQSFPGDLMKMIGIFARRRPKWISQNATGAEALEALEVILEQVEFGKILRMGSRLGLIERGKQEGEPNGG